MPPESLPCSNAFRHASAPSVLAPAFASASSSLNTWTGEPSAAEPPLHSATIATLSELSAPSSELLHTNVENAPGRLTLVGRLISLHLCRRGRLLGGRSAGHDRRGLLHRRGRGRLRGDRRVVVGLLDLLPVLRALPAAHEARLTRARVV